MEDDKLKRKRVAIVGHVNHGSTVADRKLYEATKALETKHEIVVLDVGDEEKTIADVVRERGIGVVGMGSMASVTEQLGLSSRKQIEIASHELLNYNFGEKIVHRKFQVISKETRKACIKKCKSKSKMAKNSRKKNRKK